MRVLKRNGTYQDVHFDKITARISHLSGGLSVDPVLVAQKVCGQLVDGIKTCELDEISAQNCMSMYTIHPDYNIHHDCSFHTYFCFADTIFQDYIF